MKVWLSLPIIIIVIILKEYFEPKTGYNLHVATTHNKYIGGILHSYFGHCIMSTL